MENGEKHQTTMRLTYSVPPSYELKTPYKNGTTHVVFEPLDFIARLAALVPKPRFHLTRFHGVFAPNSKHRAAVTGEGKEKQLPSIATTDLPADCEERRGKMSWAMRLKRVFNIDVTVWGFSQEGTEFPRTHLQPFSSLGCSQ